MTLSDHDPKSPRSQSDSVARVRRVTRRFALTPVFILIALALGGCELPSFGAYRGATKQAQTEFRLWSWTFIAGLAVAIIVWFLIFWCVGAYRRRDGRIPRQFHEHIPLEITYTIIPLVIVGGLFYATVIAENSIDAVSPKPTEIVHVTAYRWGWRFAYDDTAGASQHVLIQTTAEPTLLAQPDTSPTYPQLVLPDDSTVRIVLNSSDVVHGFYIPEFNFSRYAQPGVTNVFDFTTATDGIFRGQCAQYCGLYHSEMIFSVKVEPPSEFSQWLQSEQS